MDLRQSGLDICTSCGPLTRQAKEMIDSKVLENQHIFKKINLAMTVFLRGYVLNLNEEIFILKQDTASQIYDD